MSKLRKVEDQSPKLQKFVLILFGLGPIILICFFLASNGFFENYTF